MRVSRRCCTFLLCICILGAYLWFILAHGECCSFVWVASCHCYGKSLVEGLIPVQGGFLPVGCSADCWVEGVVVSVELGCPSPFIMTNSLLVKLLERLQITSNTCRWTEIVTCDEHQAKSQVLRGLSSWHSDSAFRVVREVSENHHKKLLMDSVAQVIN